MDPAQFVEEYSAYGRRIMRTLLIPGLIGAVAVVVLHLLTWQLNTTTPPESPSALALSPVSAELVVSGFGILAAVAVALQLAVRSRADSSGQDLAAVLARRHFLREVSQLLVVGSFALAAYATGPAVLALPEVFDLAKLLGPSAAAAFVALIAADAGSATDSVFTPDELQKASRKRESDQLEHAISLLNVQRPPTSWNLQVQWLALFVIPAAYGTAAWMLAHNELGLELWGLLMFACGLAGLVYVSSTAVCELVLTRSWLGVTAILSFAVIYTCVGLFALWSWLVAHTPQVLLSATAGALLFVLLPGCLAGLSLRSQRGALAHAVSRRLTSMLARLQESTSTSPPAPRNPLAVAAAMLFWLLPAVLVLAPIAKRQISSANAVKSSSQRGLGCLRFAVRGSVALNVVVVVGLCVLASVI